jgi:hypothetical protein
MPTQASILSRAFQAADRANAPNLRNRSENNVRTSMAKNVAHYIAELGSVLTMLSSPYPPPFWRKLGIDVRIFSMSFAEMQSECTR